MSDVSKDSTALHLKYRPRNLEEVIGHETVVSKLRGIIKTGKFPSALMLTGPASAGKTTLARALAGSFYDVAEVSKHPDFFEANATDKKTIDDVREWIRISRLRPQFGKRRFMLIDEVQGLLSNPQATQALLKPLEEPSSTTTWILASMEPDKFGSTQAGRALLTRCVQFALQPFAQEDLRKQAIRIIKGERLSFFTKEAVTQLVDNCNGEMRTLAQLIQSVEMYYSGLDSPPEKISATDVDSVIAASETADDVTAVRVLTAIYTGKPGAAAREMLNVADAFQFINKMIWLNYFVLNNFLLKGARHPKVWGSKHAFALVKNSQAIDGFNTLAVTGVTQARLVALRQQANTFAVPEAVLLSSFAYEAAASVAQLEK